MVVCLLQGQRTGKKFAEFLQWAEEEKRYEEQPRVPEREAGKLVPWERREKNQLTWVYSSRSNLFLLLLSPLPCNIAWLALHSTPFLVKLFPKDMKVWSSGNLLVREQRKSCRSTGQGVGVGGARKAPQSHWPGPHQKGMPSWKV